MNRPVFRRARASDARALLDLEAEFYREEGYGFDRTRAATALSGLLRDPRRGWAWVAEADGRLVGFLLVTLGWSLEYGGRVAVVDEIYLARDERGRGLGSKALALAERAAAAAGARALHLEVERSKRAAYGLYRRRGFADRGRRLLTKVLQPVPPGGAAGPTPRARASRTRPSTRRGPASRRS